MKKLLFVLLLFASTAKAQFSDFTIDSCYFAGSIEIEQPTFTGNEWFFTQCDNEFDITPGFNKLIVFGIRTINMGPHDADFWSANNQQDLYFDSCHYHMHIEGFNTVALTNLCGDTIRQIAKIGFNLQDGGNFMSWMQFDPTSCQNMWVNSIYPPDYSLSVHPPNDDFNGDTHIGLSAGYYDTYPAQAFGNSINITGQPDGAYLLRFHGNYSHYFNQGLNLYPDDLDFPVTISGGTISLGATTTIPDAPTNCTAENPNRSNTVNITWSTVSGACEYSVQRWIVRGHNAISASGAPVTVKTNSYSFDGNLIPRGWYLWKITAVNPAGVSGEGTTNRLNVR